MRATLECGRVIAVTNFSSTDRGNYLYLFLKYGNGGLYGLGLDEEGSEILRYGNGSVALDAVVSITTTLLTKEIVLEMIEKLPKHGRDSLRRMIEMLNWEHSVEIELPSVYGGE